MRRVRLAVIGAGMAGRAHAAGYRSIRSTYTAPPAEVELVAAVDVHEPAARDLARRFGFERVATDWRAVVEAPDIDAVSVVLPNHEHLGVVEALTGAGKHVLCEKPLAPTAVEAMRLERAAAGAGVVAQVGFVHRHAPAIAAIRELVSDGRLGAPMQFIARYLSDHGRDPAIPHSWRHDIDLAGGGSLVDIGSHVVDTSRILCGEIGHVSGAVLRTVVTERPVAAGRTRGHEQTAVTDETRPVTTDDHATFVAGFESGCVGSFTTSRVATGFRNSAAFALVGSRGSATFDWERVGEFGFMEAGDEPSTEGFSTVIVGPSHPYLADGLVMPVAGVGHGLADAFVFQARDFIEGVATGHLSPSVASFADGVAGALVMDAVKRSAQVHGDRIAVADVRAEAERALEAA